MNVPLFFVTALALFLSLLLLLFNRGYKTANRFLAVSIMLLAFHHFFRYTAFFTDWIDFAAAFITTTSFSVLLLPPLMYFYVRSILLDNARLSRKDYLHFLPFALAFVGIIPYLLSSYDTKLLAASELLGLGGSNRIVSVRLNIFFPNIFFGFMRTFQLFIYTIAIWRLMWIHHSRLFSTNPKYAQLSVIKNWLLIVCISLSQFCFTSIVINLLGLTSMNKADLIRNINLFIWISSINFVVINFTLFFYPQILYGLPIYIPNTKTSPRKDVTITVKEPNKEIVTDTEEENPVLSNLIPIFQEEYVKEIDQLLEDVVNAEKYLTPVFTIVFLSDDIKIPVHHLSFYFNNVNQTTFTDWRNRMRVQYAKRLIEEGILDAITLQALGEKCGFSTNNTFIRAFKNCTGNTPSLYAKTFVS